MVTFCELPEYIVFGECFRIGHIQGKNSLPTGANARNQNTAPLATYISLRDCRRSIVDAEVAIVLVGNLVQFACDKSRDIGECFLAVGIVKSVQHSVVGIGKNHGLAGFIGVEERVVVRADNASRRRAHIDQAAVDNVAQHDVARPERPQWVRRFDFLAPVAPQVGEPVHTQGVSHNRAAIWHRIERVFVGLCKIGPVEKRR